MNRVLNKILSAGGIGTVLVAVSLFGSTAFAQTIPAPAAAAGYTTRTYGPNVTIGTNWRKSIPESTAVQNGDGSVTTAGPWHYNDLLTTNSIAAFGGGGYFEATFRYDNPNAGWSANQAIGWPSWWANTLEGRDLPFANTRGIEVDFYEAMAADNHWSCGIHDWYGTSGHQANGKEIDMPTGTDGHSLHKYGYLWVPATASTKGYGACYFDGILVPGSENTWNQYNPNDTPPYSIGGSFAAALDVQHLYLMLGTGAPNPETVTSVEVWQNSNANNMGATTNTPGTGGITPAQQPAIGSCNQAYTNGVTVPAGYGAAYNLFSAGHELLVQVDCSYLAAVMSAGSGSGSQYIYKLGYAYQNGAWQPVNLTSANALISNSWFTGSAQGKLPYSNAELSNWNYIVDYVCTWNGSAWQCGCHDSACVSNFWQLQAIQGQLGTTNGPALPSGGSSASSGGTGSESTQGTTIPSASSITDSQGNSWTLVTGGKIAKNGNVDASTAGVTTLLYFNHTVYQGTTIYGWFMWTGSAWTQVAKDPRV